MSKIRNTVSIVIPAYNEERYLGACLESIAAQTIMPDEVIVVNNNSTDGTARIAARFPFVKLIDEPRQGLRFSRNTGLDAAQGDIIGRIDADTRLSPDWCERVRQCFLDSDVAAATGPCYYHDMPAPRLSLKADRSLRHWSFRTGEMILYGSNMILRRKVWRDIRKSVCMNGEFFEDCDMTIHIHELDYVTKYDETIIVGASARRLDDSLREFYLNMQQFRRTYAMHGQYNLAALRARTIFSAGYMPLKLIRRAYDPATHTLSLRRFLGTPTETARPNANT